MAELRLKAERKKLNETPRRARKWACWLFRVAVHGMVGELCGRMGQEWVSWREYSRMARLLRAPIRRSQKSRPEEQLA